MLLNGSVGALDEIAVVVLAFGVLWVAVKLGGRGRRDEAEDGDDEPEEGGAAASERQPGPAEERPGRPEGRREPPGAGS